MPYLERIFRRNSQSQPRVSATNAVIKARSKLGITVAAISNIPVDMSMGIYSCRYAREPPSPDLISTGSN
jgi:hypothetical protein